MLEDKLLIWKLKHGDKDALRRIYERYGDNMRTIACSLLHDTHAAEDVLHDVFVSFAQSAGQLEIKSSLKNYLIACVVNRVRDVFRNKGPQPVELEQAESINSNAACADTLLITDEKSGLLADALAEIPFEQREVIMLRLKGGMKLREIARLQKTSASTVQGRYRYGLEKLRIILDGKMNK